VQRDWWLRTLLVLQRPRPVFAALRADDADHRQEPVLAIVVLAGTAGVLSTNAAAGILDDFAVSQAAVPVWALLGGVIYGTFLYFVLGFLLYAGGRALGARARYRGMRHLLAFAAVPLALSLLAWPVRIAAFGEDSFKRGGADEGVGGRVFEAIELAALGWGAVLVVVGVRALEDWPWWRSLLAALPVLAVLVLVLGRAFGLV
jgi:hypothetical protein